MLAIGATNAAAQVTIVTIGKQFTYAQTSAAGVALVADRPYEFFANVRGTAPPAQAAALVGSDRLAAPGVLLEPQRNDGLQRIPEPMGFQLACKYDHRDFPDLPRWDLLLQVEGQMVP
jgi:hypothetical protein